MGTQSLRLRDISIAAICASTVMLSACASGGAAYEPIVDGPTGQRYQADLYDCQQLAENRNYNNSDTRTSAAVGAGVGGVAGVARSGDFGDAAVGAAIGGLFGGGGGALNTRQERKQIVMTCLRGRGHRVVG